MNHWMEPKCDNKQLGHVEALAQKAHGDALRIAEHGEALEQEECVEAQVQVVDNICGDHPDHQPKNGQAETQQEVEQSVVPYMDLQEEHVQPQGAFPHQTVVDALLQ